MAVPFTVLARTSGCASLTHGVSLPRQTVRIINDNLTREASVARAKMDRLRRVDRTRINVCETINGAEVFLPNIYKKRCGR